MKFKKIYSTPDGSWNINEWTHEIDIFELGTIYSPVLLTDGENFYIYGWWSVKPAFLKEICGIDSDKWQKMREAFQKKTGIDIDITDFDLEPVNILRNFISFCQKKFNEFQCFEPGKIDDDCTYPVLCELVKTRNWYELEAWVLEGSECEEIEIIE